MEGGRQRSQTLPGSWATVYLEHWGGGGGLKVGKKPYAIISSVFKYSETKYLKCCFPDKR